MKNEKPIITDPFKRLDEVNCVRFYKDSIVIVLESLKCIRVTVPEQEIKFVITDMIKAKIDLEDDE